jgi:hypothetical protein
MIGGRLRASAMGSAPLMNEILINMRLIERLKI